MADMQSAASSNHSNCYAICSGDEIFRLCNMERERKPTTLYAQRKVLDTISSRSVSHSCQNHALNLSAASRVARNAAEVGHKYFESGIVYSYSFVYASACAVFSYPACYAHHFLIRSRASAAASTSSATPASTQKEKQSAKSKGKQRANEVSDGDAEEHRDKTVDEFDLVPDSDPEDMSHQHDQLDGEDDDNVELPPPLRHATQQTQAHANRNGIYASQGSGEPPMPTPTLGPNDESEEDCIKVPTHLRHRISGPWKLILTKLNSANLSRMLSTARYL